MSRLGDPVRDGQDRSGASIDPRTTGERSRPARFTNRPAYHFSDRSRLMSRQVVSTHDAPESPLYSQAVKAGNTVYVAGTIGVDVTTGGFAGPTVQEQARQSLLNCQAILRAAGAELGDAVMVHTLLAHSEDADALGEVFEEFFPDVRPPRCVSKIGVDRPGLLISIAMVAVTD